MSRGRGFFSCADLLAFPAPAPLESLAGRFLLGSCDKRTNINNASSRRWYECKINGRRTFVFGGLDNTFGGSAISLIATGGTSTVVVSLLGEFDDGGGELLTDE